MSLPDPELFYTRLTSAICAPVFIWLTGLSAWLYSQRHSKFETSKFLVKRGAFLVLLELTLIVFCGLVNIPGFVLPSSDLVHWAVHDSSRWSYFSADKIAIDDWNNYCGRS